ncbi:hypothetical protein GCM10017607_11460 [Microbacterium thalassium]|nr:hypothetical protein GCM10017607_11460 [Microbacterium thalassium]
MIVAVSPALIASLLAVLRARITHPGTPFVVWVQDLYTLGLAETGQGRRGVVQIMSAIEGTLLRMADRVVVIHGRFADRIAEDFGVPRERIEVIRNWSHLAPAPDIDIEAARSRFGWSDRETVVLHAGNMGLKQGLHNVVEAAREAHRTGAPIRFVLLGAGSELAKLKAAGADLPTLQFMEPLDDDGFAAALAGADILLVNELQGVAEMAVPSKLTSYFAAGRPVVAATNVDGITADEVRTAEAGVVVPAGAPAELVEAIIGVASDPEAARRMGENGRRYRHTVLGEEAAVDSFSAMLDRLIGRDPETIDIVPDSLTVDAQ